MTFDYEKSIWGGGEASLAWSSPASFRLRQSLKSLKGIDAGSKVLEVGCGAGQFIRAIKKIRPELICYGSDISQTALESAANIGGGVEYCLSESKRLPFPDNHFGAILIFDVLEHVEIPGMILDEARRVLKDGGVFYCFVPCESDFFSLWNFLDKFGLKKDLTKKYAGHINYFSRRSLCKLLESHGFKISSQRFSEHIIGQLVGVAAFIMMDRAAKRKGVDQLNNEQYFTGLNGRGTSLIKKIVNTLIYLESVIFSRIPSPNVHIIMRKF